MRKTAQNKLSETGRNWNHIQSTLLQRSHFQYWTFCLLEYRLVSRSNDKVRIHSRGNRGCLDLRKTKWGNTENRRRRTWCTAFVMTIRWMRFAWVCSMSRWQHKILEWMSKKAVVKWLQMGRYEQKLDFPLTTFSPVSLLSNMLCYK